MVHILIPTPLILFQMSWHCFSMLFCILLSLTPSDCRKPKEPKADSDFLDLDTLEEETNSTTEIPDPFFPPNDELIALLKNLKLKSSAGEYEPNSDVVAMLKELKNIELEVHPEKKRAKELADIIDDLVQIQQLV